MAAGHFRWSAPNTLNQWLSLIVLFIALGMALWAARWSIAALYSYPAQWVLEGWEQAQPGQPSARAIPATEERWQAAVASLAKAWALEPNNPHTLFLLGRLYHHHALNRSPWTAQAKADWRQAILSYQQALQLRPSWGYLWILSAQARLQAGNAAKEVMADLSRALRFAPYYRDVQLTAIRIGFALWPLLDKEQRASIDRLTAQIFAQDGEIILQQAAKYRLLKHLQPLLTKNPQWKIRFNQLSQPG